MQAVDSDVDPNNDLDFRGVYGSDLAVANAVADMIGSDLDPDIVFVHFDEVDGAGHSSGSSSPNYEAQIEIIDQYIGHIQQAVSNRSNFQNEDWQIIVTADHLQSRQLEMARTGRLKSGSGISTIRG